MNGFTDDTPTKIDTLTDQFQDIELQQALTMVSKRQLLRTDERDRLLVAVFTDGLEIAWQSEAGGPISDITPDMDWHPPTVMVRQASPPK